jgi:regulator of protease activity HflC (stomatin/prohibitin superfamily)
VPKISSNYIDSIANKYADEISDQIEIVAPVEGQVAIVTLNSRLYDLVTSGNKAYYWKDAGKVAVEYVSVKDEIFVSDKYVSLFKDYGLLNVNIVQFINVPEENVGILYENNVFKKELEPGMYYVWSVGRSVRVQVIDKRILEKEVTGQEVLTKDKVTIRANLVCYYQVKEPLKAVSELKDFDDYLHKQLQFTLRQNIESKTLDEVLDSKSTLDADITTTVANELEKFGITVTKVAVKDIILPGEMREILNQVIQAEKLAEANVIKRREETAATRSLLNTAKLMDDHPTLLRLKELESLENILQKVDNLSVYGGVESLIGKLFQDSKK